MSEREVSELIVLLINQVALVLQLLLMTQYLISLNEIHLLLSLVLFDQLLIHKHLLPKVVKELLVLSLFFTILKIFLFFLTVDLGDNVLEELLIISLSRVKFNSLGEPLTSATFDEGREERVRKTLLLEFFL